jgi:hypothetical protein
MQFEIHTHTIADHYLPALINGDYTGLDDGEEAYLLSWLDWACDDWEDSDGNRWAFAHYGNYEPNDFAECEVTCLQAMTAKLDIVFTLKK